MAFAQGLEAFELRGLPRRQLSGIRGAGRWHRLDQPTHQRQQGTADLPGQPAGRLGQTPRPNKPRKHMGLGPSMQDGSNVRHEDGERQNDACRAEKFFIQVVRRLMSQISRAASGVGRICLVRRYSSGPIGIFRNFVFHVSIKPNHSIKVPELTNIH